MACAFATPGIDSLESHPSTMVHEPSFRIWNTLGGLPTDARPFKPLLAHFALGQLPTSPVPPCTGSQNLCLNPFPGTVAPISCTIKGKMVLCSSLRPC